MIKYKIALINVFWSENENNTRYFINQNEQNSYFDNLASGKTSPLVNYNMGNNIITTIVYKDTTTRRVDEIVKSNYAIVYTIDYNEETKAETILNRRYFFAYPRQDSGRQMIVDLVLDDVQTNFISQQASFNRDVLITRANLNRYVWDSVAGKFKFNIGNAESPFYQVEDFKECPKRLTMRTPLNLKCDSNNNSEFDSYLNSNIIGWEYIYLAPFHDYNIIPLGATPAVNLKLPQLMSLFKDSDWNLSFTEDSIFSNIVNGSCVCICVPVYRSDSHYGIDNVIKFTDSNHNICVTNYGLEKFLESNSNNTYVYARKFSLMPPFRIKSVSTSDYSIDSRNNNLNLLCNGNEVGLIYSSEFYIVKTGVKSYDGNDYNHGIIVMYYDYDGLAPHPTNEYTINKQLEFTATEIVTGSKDDVKFNPKLLSEQFFELNLVNFSQSFTYDVEKLGSNQIRVLYNEALTPDITKGYARIQTPKGLYVGDCNQNLTGLVISNDQSLMVANDKLSEMLANNKNFFLQQALNIGKSAIGGAIGGGFAGIGGLAGAVLGAGSGVANMFMNLDNMRNAPAQIKNANGNVYFAGDIQPFRLAIEEYEALDFDKKAFNDYCYMFGYKYNRMGLLANFINIRHNFNYIEADLINVPVSMQNEEKRRLIEKFRSGIRFWNTDSMSYTGQNYENSVYTQYQEEIANEQNG